MPITDSPLRYPGGKSQLSKFVTNIIKINNLKNVTYIEPFSGGAGISISLLLHNYVDTIVINDYDPAVHAFWYSVLNYTNDFIYLIENTDVNIENWEKQKSIYNKLRHDPFSIENGFATFFLNRTNRSGIISGGPIGGIKQKSKYKLDCRFTKKNLINKIVKIKNKRNQINLYNMDAKILIDSVIANMDSSTTFCFFDPPYFKQGKNLYTNFFQPKDHVDLYKSITKLSDFYWITTYDYHYEILNIYKTLQAYEYTIQYSAQKKRKEKELLFCSEVTQVESFDKIIVNKINRLTTTN